MASQSGNNLKSMGRRSAWLTAGTLLVVLLLAGRLFWLQMVKGEEYAVQAVAFRTRTVAITASRGTIADRNGNLLALSIDAHSVYAIPGSIKDKETTARQLADTLGLSYGEIYAKLDSTRSYVILATKITPETARQVRELKLSGIGLERKDQRFYPLDSFAAQVIGFAGSDNQGLYGLELQYEAVLAGENGQALGEFNSAGREVPGGMLEYTPPVDGHNLILTLDETIQYTVEKELAKAVQDNKAKRGIAIVLDTTTGGVLAMASKPDFNPNTPGEATAELWRNPAILDRYEPGSTFKSVILGAALEEGLTWKEEHFNCPGHIKLPGANISCIRAHGDQTLTEAVENSCNVAFATLGLRLGAEKLYRYAGAFSIGVKTGIDFPGEAAGLMIATNLLRQVDLARIGIGQAITATPLQMVNIYSIIANGGVMLQPHLVKEIRGSDGQLISALEPAATRRVISPATAAIERAMLESVVTNGSGSNAFIAGYHVAGKTGTAQKVIDGKYSPDKYISSFAGFAPSDYPRVAVIVILDEPGGSLHYGGQICAPVFKTIVQASLQHLGVLPTLTEPAAVETPGTDRSVSVPSVRFLPLEEAKAKLAGAGLKPEVEGQGVMVLKQSPGPLAVVKPGSTVTLTLGDQSLVQDNTTYSVVPDLTGKTIRAGAEMLESYGLFMQAVGTGTAVRQDPKAGTPVTAGTTIKVTFE